MYPVQNYTSFEHKSKSFTACYSHYILSSYQGRGLGNDAGFEPATTGFINDIYFQITELLPHIVYLLLTLYVLFIRCRVSVKRSPAQPLPLKQQQTNHIQKIKVTKYIAIIIHVKYFTFSLTNSTA